MKIYAVLLTVALYHIYPTEGLSLVDPRQNYSSSAEEWTPMEDCRRTCNGETKTCYLKLHVERYTVLGPACRHCEKGVQEDCLRPQCVTADGYQRSVITLNRMIPAPAIEVCRNDKLIVDVVNQMPDETTSIHWHGFRQVGTQYYDGVPYVTQCPILPASTFRYKLTAEDVGTNFYHSHTGTQKLDGVAGALIVRDVKENDIQADYYDEDLPEHVVVIGDWTHVPAEHLVPGLHSDKITQSPVTYLINGRGKYFDDKSNVVLPIEEFVVEHGKRYRFRLVGATCMTCGVAISFEGHSLTVLCADGGLTFDPVEVHTVLMNPADRFDVVLNATQPEGIYTIKVQGVGPGCENTFQHAILRYKNAKASNTLPPPPSKEIWGTMFNDITSKCDGLSESDLCISHLKGVDDAPKITDPEMYQQIDIGFGFYFTNEEEMFKEGSYLSYDEPVKGLYAKPYINKVSFSPPPSPMLSQLSDIPQEYYCSDECKQGNKSTCTCGNVFEIKKDSVVDIIISDEDSLFAHPFHLHGYNFYIMEMKGGFTNLPLEIAAVKERLRNDEISLKDRPQRDTISVPYGGYAAIRFVANNPGFWILHCHFAFHLEGGMAVVLKVGEPEDLPLAPKNFPRCGNFIEP